MNEPPVLSDMWVLAQLSEDHRYAQAKLHALVVLYRETLEAYGIEPPTHDGAEALARYRHAFVQLEEHGIVDTGMHGELTVAERWRK